MWLHQLPLGWPGGEVNDDCNASESHIGTDNIFNEKGGSGVRMKNN